MPDLDAVWVDGDDPRAEALLAAAADGIATYRVGLVTQVQVATQLGVSQMTISRDLGEFSHGANT